LQLVVGTDGLPSDIKVDRGLTPELEKAAIDAVKKWKFTPANKDGHPVPVQIKVEVSFNLY
jgi:TonB family protein